MSALGDFADERGIAAGDEADPEQTSAAAENRQGNQCRGSDVPRKRGVGRRSHRRVREDYAMKRTRRTIEEVNASIEEQMSRLREELSDLRRSIGENASDDTKSALRSLQQRIDRLADDAASWTREGVQQTRDTIAQNPLAAVGLALVLGVILGGVIARR